MKYLFIFTILFLFILLPAAHTEPASSPSPAPPFSVESGDGTIVTGTHLKGKIVVMFYEKRNIVKKNADMKDRLNALLDQQPDSIRNTIARLPVIDCSNVFWPVSEIWKKGLRDNSKRVGMPVYCDWSGHISRDFRMIPDESNMLILDSQGIIRYRFSGKIDQNRFEDIKIALDHLVNNKNHQN